MTSDAGQRCPKCGTRTEGALPPGALCPTCGSRLDTPAEDPPAGVGRGGIILAACISIVALGFAVGSAWVIAWKLESYAQAQTALQRNTATLQTEIQSLTLEHRELTKAAARGAEETIQLREGFDKVREQVLDATRAVESLGRTSSSPAVARWVEYADNPVFTRDGPISYPWVVYDAQRFGQETGPYYKMWYDTSDDGVNPNLNCRVGLAASPDGIHWTDLGVVRRQNDSFAGHPCVLYSPTRFGNDKGHAYRLYYWDGQNRVLADESDDGVSWRPIADFTVITEAIRDRARTGNDLYSMQVSCDDGGTPADPRDDSYQGWVDFSGRLHLITSADGVHWRSPALRLHPSNDVVVTSACSAFRSFGRTFHLFFGYGDQTFAGGTPAGEGIAYLEVQALERDALPVFPSPPRIFHVTDGVPWRSFITMCPCVVYDADSFSGHGDRVHYKMWLAGVSRDKKSAIGYATLRAELPGPSSPGAKDPAGRGNP